MQGHDGRRLEPEIGLEVLSDFSHQSLEGQLPDEELCALLVTPDLSQGDGSWPVTVRFLDASGSRCGFSGGLGGQLLPWSLSPVDLRAVCLVRAILNER